MERYKTPDVVNTEHFIDPVIKKLSENWTKENINNFYIKYKTIIEKLIYRECKKFESLHWYNPESLTFEEIKSACNELFLEILKTYIPQFYTIKEDFIEKSLAKQLNEKQDAVKIVLKDRNISDEAYFEKAFWQYISNIISWRIKDIFQIQVTKFSYNKKQIPVSMELLDAIKNYIKAKQDLTNGSYIFNYSPVTTEQLEKLLKEVNKSTNPLVDLENICEGIEEVLYYQSKSIELFYEHVLIKTDKTRLLLADMCKMILNYLIEKGDNEVTQVFNILKDFYLNKINIEDLAKKYKIFNAHVTRTHQDAILLMSIIFYSIKPEYFSTDVKIPQNNSRAGKLLSFIFTIIEELKNHDFIKYIKAKLDSEEIESEFKIFVIEPETEQD